MALLRGLWGLWHYYGTTTGTMGTMALLRGLWHYYGDYGTTTGTMALLWHYYGDRRSRTASRCETSGRVHASKYLPCQRGPAKRELTANPSSGRAEGYPISTPVLVPLLLVREYCWYERVLLVRESTAGTRVLLVRGYCWCAGVLLVRDCPAGTYKRSHSASAVASERVSEGCTRSGSGSASLRARCRSRAFPSNGCLHRAAAPIQ
jgi:hypothetical protein